MNNLNEKVSYLMGLMEGMNIDTNANEGKLFAKIVETLEELSREVDYINEDLDDMEEYLDAMDDDLTDLEDDFYELEDEEDEDEFYEWNVLHATIFSIWTNPTLSSTTRVLSKSLAP